MPNILTPIGQSFTNKPNIAATYGPYASIAAAHVALSDDNLNIIGMTVGIQVDANHIEEYWYQGGTTQAHLVKKQMVEDIPASALAGDIPASKLSSGVQTSLGKADTAYQKPGTGIPESDLASAVQTSLGKADTAFQKPGTGIQASDLASAVQTSLGKADTAVQPADIAALDGNPSGTSADGHVSVQVTEVDGVVNAVNVTTNDIASASALAGEVSRAQGAEAALDAEKADKATTLYGYGITNAYTKSEVDGMVSTPHQNYVTVSDYASLPATGSDDTIYRVSCWDGAYNSGVGQVDDTKYTEYAWNGSAYVLLRVMDATAEVFDISAYNNATYDDLTDALGVSGANVPADLRAGGMSVRFINTATNQYEQYRLMSPTWSTVVSDWQGVDDEPTAGSDNLVESGGVNAAITKVVNGDSITLDCYDFPLSGRWVNGNKSTESDWLSSNLISITPGSTIKCYSNSGGSTNTNMITFFKKDRTFLSCVHGSEQNALVEYDATAPEDAWYVAFTKNTSNIAISNDSHYVVTYNDISASKLKNYINELNDKAFSNEVRIDNIEDILELPFTYDLTDGKYFTANGSIADSGPYAISDVILVHTGDILSIQTNISLSEIAVIVSCDSEGNNRSALVVGNSSKSYSYTVVNDGYVRFCVWKSDYSVNMQRRNVVASIENNVSILQSKVEDIDGVLEITNNSDVPVFTENSGYYIVWDTGAIGTSFVYSYSSPILLGSNKKIKLKSYTAITVSAITKCDSSGNNRVTLVKGVGDFSNDFVYANTSEEDIYVIISYRHDHEHSVSIVDANAIDGIKNDIETLADENNALDNRLTAEEEKVSNINNILKLSFEYNLEDGKFFTSSGAIGNSGPYSISSVIPVNKGDVLSVNTNITWSEIAIIVSCNSSGTNSSPLVVGNSTKSYSYAANEKGYIRFCVWTSDYTVSMQRADVIANLQSRVATTEEALDISSDITTPSFTPTAGGYVVWADGSISMSAQVYSYTSPILLEAGKKIIATCAAAITVAAITKCDSSGENRVPLVKGTDDSVVDYTFINSSDEDIYVIISYRNNLSNSVKIYSNNAIETINGQISSIKGDIEELQSATGNIGFISDLDFCKFAETCICIGDSVTEGHIYDYPRTTDSGTVDKTLSYPAALQKLTGWTVVNAGKAGWTATKWYRDYAETYDFSDYEICIIEFGYNGQLTDTLDTDVEPYDDYEDFANTETGNYCRIIARALSENPSIFIVLNISPYLEHIGGGDVSCSVIKKIAAKYGLPVIDLENNTLLNLNADRFHGKMSGGTVNIVHMNAIGYFAKGTVIKKYLDKYFNEYASKYNLIKYE